jgi:hypothetical protein
MEIHELAKSYHFTKEKRDEKNRVITYEHPRKLKDLESKTFDVDSKLRVVSFKNDIKNDEAILEQYDAELKEIYAELKPMLEEVNANTDDRLEVHLHGQIYLSAYLNEDDDIITSSYHKVS